MQFMAMSNSVFEAFALKKTVETGHALWRVVCNFLLLFVL